LSSPERMGVDSLSGPARCLTIVCFAMEDYPRYFLDSLANLLGDRKGVWWAVQSSKMVPPGGTSPLDKLAASAAEGWVKNPTPATQAAAVEAAKKTDFQGPGAWAAQAAGWADPAGKGAGAAAAPRPIGAPGAGMAAAGTALGAAAGSTG